MIDRWGVARARDMTNEFLIGSRHIGDRSALSAGGGRQADRQRRRQDVDVGEIKDE